MHEGNKYSCNVCDGSLWRHKQFVHEGKKQFPCDMCNYRAARKENLRRHIQTVHKNVIIDAAIST